MSRRRGRLARARYGNAGEWVPFTARRGDKKACETSVTWDRVEFRKDAFSP